MSTAAPAVAQVLINGTWKDADTQSTFQATDPNQNQTLDATFPVSSWSDCDAALDAAADAARKIRRLPAAKIAEFLRAYADEIESAKDDLVNAAFAETGLAKSPRLADVELPRTTNQLRLAADACESGDWAMATIDTATGIRSCFEPIGPVAVFGPNNFPFAFGSVSGGDFAAAIAAGNPVIGKANSSHPETTRLFAVAALKAIQQTGMPAATVQLIYRTSHADGERLVADPRLAATGYTGSRSAGLKLKAAADAAGKPIYLELSSVNPVVITPNALAERGDAIVDEFVTSVLMGTGQFCTNPGMVMLVRGESSDQFIDAVRQKFESTAAGTLLSPAVAKSLSSSVQTLVDYGAKLITGGGDVESDRCAMANTLMTVDGKSFLGNPDGFQTEAFGNASLMVVCDDLEQLCQAISHLEGNLTGCVYSATGSSDEDVYRKVEFELKPKVGRLLNDKMPTGVAVSPAMNHGGPYPSTGHPGFTAVGIPASMIRFGKLTSFDNIRAERLPALLANANPTGKTWRRIDGTWSAGDVS
ncbi:aldehyde dehydrogenase (NADP(+)) [Crateriforma conspicua]|uniref:2,5-dioxovalerate dehydrogenase n=1 Tax=Crateriforma conspicua TaxID=2527996 RepID=A0A5C5Y7U4_9PLAN|nr:aldehyde dehydrogenase (NADP(+)) [Crateriforma conspicua]QDV64040.1 NADP-dependent fatty aldehyde dehydrogenase [Crateriforma conspicua]TWT69422.1 NADP-dependent fatty aldehyde dehydrogenase [Crateriforma conspicua]